MVATAIIFSSLTYLFAPEKVKIKTVTKVVKVKGETKIVNRDIVRVIEKKPDGTTIIREEDKSVEKEKKVETVAQETIKEKEVTRKKKNWLLSAGALAEITQASAPKWYGQVQRRIAGDIYVGIIATTDQEIGIGITIKF